MGGAGLECMRKAPPRSLLSPGKEKESKLPTFSRRLLTRKPLHVNASPVQKGARPKIVGVVENLAARLNLFYRITDVCATPFPNLGCKIVDVLL